MNEAEMSEAEKIVSEGTAATAGWVQSLLSRLAGGLKKSGTALQEASQPAAPSAPKQASPQQGSAAPPERPATDRAEETLDQAGEKIGIFAAEFSHCLRKSVALVREEAEDVLAEAQSLRHKGHV